MSERLRVTHGAVGDPLTWLAAQPITEKSELVDPTVEHSWLRRFRKLELKATSGSTGRPVRLCKSMDMAAQIDATMWALYRWHGIHPGTRHARFWGLEASGRKRWLRRGADRLLSRRRLSAFQFSEEAVIRHFHALRRFSPEYLHAYPSLADRFAEICGQHDLDGTDLGIRVVFLTGELLRPEVRSRVSRFFGARVVNEYGCSESGLLAFECEAGTMHLTPTAALLEASPQGEVPPEQTGAHGQALVTDLYGHHMPLRRYRLGDRIALRHGESCDCGRRLPAVDTTAGRVHQLLLLSDGERIHAGFLPRTMPNGIRRFRAVQPDRKRLIVQIETSTKSDGDVLAAKVERSIEDYIKGRLDVEVTLVREIGPDPNGKLRYFIPLEET